MKLAAYKPGLKAGPQAYVDPGDTRLATNGLWTATGHINLYMRDLNTPEGF